MACRAAGPDLLRFDFLFKLFGLVGADERVNDVLDFAAENGRQVVNRQADAVVSQTVLREVVGADL